MANDENKPDEDKAAHDAAAAAKKAERAEKARQKAAAGGGLAAAKKKGGEPTGPAPKYKRDTPPRLKKKYDETIRGAMMKEFSYSTVMEVPRILKVSVNMGLGKAKEEPKMIDNGIEELKLICGQSPVVSKAKKDIAVFKLRKGQKIGVMVTLRRERMWEFLDRLLNIALPRVRDFRGVSPRGFDGRGNFTMGVREQIIFPEIEYDKIDSIKGMNISIVTTAKTDAEGRALLVHLGMPFRQPPPVIPGATA
jgi:large subunit ribosomal protein L5